MVDLFYNNAGRSCVSLIFNIYAGNKKIFRVVQRNKTIGTMHYASQLLHLIRIT